LKTSDLCKIQQVTLKDKTQDKLINFADNTHFKNTKKLYKAQIKLKT